jgi:hypothetical protein
MKMFFKELFFDKEIVSAIKLAELNKGQLYILLIAGKITMQEYLQAIIK